MYAVKATGSLAWVTFLEVLRSQLLLLAAGMLVVAAGIGLLLDDIAITETAQTQAAVLGALLRLGTVFATILFVAAGIVREWQDRTADMALALSLPRHCFYLGKILGFGAAAIGLAVVSSCALLPLVPAAAWSIWLLSLICEAILIANLTLMIGMSLRHQTLIVFVAIAFYVLGRSIADMRLLAQGPLQDRAGSLQQFVSSAVDLLAYVMPDLHSFTLNGWLVYPDTATVTQLLPIVGQTLVYCALIGVVGLVDLYRKNL